MFNCLFSMAPKVINRPQSKMNAPTPLNSLALSTEYVKGTPELKSKNSNGQTNIPIPTYATTIPATKSVFFINILQRI
ncbi:hypothetical protein VCRA2126O298_40082 [Vibrio crassostreae]|nr:hypothetical protein VCRA2113O224_70055 [Vibrio crassostreae]CAK2241285.1 hypothetical protein VCRA2113O194_70156 [Vibrio crassostreae]CAK2943025.1 hypothetical protein VCRA2118O237_30125 [Vibrio crassostreae]CAK3471425.1 hypothetical protein VCRA2125O290_30125 [Vibrio crassostreae]CAK3529558.1 hypothetical protein VCRA2126O298_40082 [Vibrio crassostreae]